MGNSALTAQPSDCLRPIFLPTLPLSGVRVGTLIQPDPVRAPATKTRMTSTLGPRQVLLMLL